MKRPFGAPIKLALVAGLSCANCLPQVGLGSPQVAASSGSNARPPVIGFLTDVSHSGLSPISGMMRSATVSRQIPLPGVRVFLPPLQRYGLVEQRDRNELSVWNLRNPATGASASLPPLPCSTSDVSDVIFSPSGTTAALVSSAAGSVDVISGLPANPEVRFRRAVLGGETVLAVSDDGLFLVESDPQGVLQVVTGSANQTALSRTAKIAGFVPHSRDLVIGDAIAKQSVIVHGLGTSRITETLLPENVSPGATGFTKEGKTMVAIDPEGREVQVVNLETLEVRKLPLAVPFTNVQELGDGRTFLLTTASGLRFGLLSAGSPNAGPILTVHPSRAGPDNKGD